MIEAVEEPKRWGESGADRKREDFDRFSGRVGESVGRAGKFFERERQRARQKDLIIKPVK